MQDPHRSLQPASAREKDLETVLPMPLPLPQSPGKCPPRPAAEMTFSFYYFWPRKVTGM